MKGKFALSAVLALTAALVVAGSALATTPRPGDIKDDFKVGICHATASESNPYTDPTVDKSSIINLPNGHNYHEGDIIPTFTYEVWEKTGTDVHTYEKSSDFDDSRVSIDFTDGDQKVSIDGINGWSVTGFWYDLEGGGTNYELVGAGDRNKYNPPGSADIDKVKVEVSKDTYGWVQHSYLGINLGAIAAFPWTTGAAILENDCEVPPQPVPGCMDRTAWNYNPEATVDDGSCEYDLCSNLEGLQATMPQGYEDPNQDGVCTIIVTPVPGCMDEKALNYNPLATVDDGSCKYPPDEVPGCMDPEALNYNPEATVDDKSCEYPPEVCEDPLANNVGQPLPCTYDPPTCELTPLYYQFTLTNGDQTCYQVSWDRKDEIGKPNEFWIPNVTRQLCTCGFVAENVPASGWVYKDCHGTYWYDGKPWSFFKKDLLTPHWDGQCAMGGC